MGSSRPCINKSVSEGVKAWCMTECICRDHWSCTVKGSNPSQNNIKCGEACQYITKGQRFYTGALECQEKCKEWTIDLYPALELGTGHHRKSYKCPENDITSNLISRFCHFYSYWHNKIKQYWTLLHGKVKSWLYSVLDVSIYKQFLVFLVLCTFICGHLSVTIFRNQWLFDKQIVFHYIL